MIITLPALILLAFLFWLLFHFTARHKREQRLCDKAFTAGCKLNKELNQPRGSILNQVAIFNLRSELEQAIFKAEEQHFYRARSVAKNLLNHYEDKCKKALIGYTATI